MANQNREVGPGTNLVVNSSHPIAGQLSGSVAVLSPGDTINIGNPSGAADVIATFNGNASVFAYDAGDVMRSGTAPAPRVGMFISYGGALDINSTGLTLFSNALVWMTS